MDWNLLLDQGLTYLQTAWGPASYVLMSLGGAVVLGQVYVAATPSKKDDAWLKKIEAIPVLGHFLKALKKFAPLQKKAK